MLLFFLGEAAAAPGAASDTRSKFAQNYGTLSLAFEANRGQAAEGVRFLARGPNHSLYLTSTEAVFSLPPLSLGTANPSDVGKPTSTGVHMRLVGASATAAIEGTEPLPGFSNYFIGDDPSHWHIAVPNYAKVKYRHIYPNIDLVYYGNQRQLEYDFIVAPGADPQRIALDFSGIDSLRIDAEGNLTLDTPHGAIVQHKPVVYQQVDGVRRSVHARYVLRGTRRVAFELGRYDKSHALVIDPTLVYGTYLGGSGDDDGLKVAVDGSSNVYVTGHTNSADFPATAGAAQATYAGNTDAFVAKLNATGTALVYSTYLGGSGSDSGQGIAVDGNGNVYVTGNTNSSDFPTTVGVAQPTFGGVNDAFITMLDSTGAIAYSTYLGGSGLDVGSGIAVDSNGNAYVIGYTQSVDFPTTSGVVQPALAGANDVFVACVSSTGTLIYGTYLGGSGADAGAGIAVDSGGVAYITGYTQSSNFPTTPSAYQTTFGGGSDDAFVAQLDATATTLLYSTYLGGSGNDFGTSVALDSNGDAYVAGNTSSSDFPTTAGAVQAINAGGVDAFVTSLNAAGTGLIYSTYVGGSGYETALGITVDSNDAAYVTGYTQSSNLPVTSGAYQTTFAGGTSDAFVLQLNAAGALGYSSYLGGSGSDLGYGIAVDSSGTVYMTGITSSSNFPTTAGALQSANGGGSDAFVAAIPANAFDEIFKDGFE